MVNIPSNTKEVEEPVVVSALAPEPKPSRVVLDSSSASELEQSQSMMVHDLKLNPSDKKEVRRELEQSAFKSLEDLGVKPNQSGVKSKDFTFIMAKVNSLEDQAKEVPGYWRCRGELDLSLDEKMSARMMTEAPPEPQAPSGQAVQGKESKTPQPAPRAESTTKPKMAPPNSKAAPRTCKVMKTGIRMATWIRQTARKIRKSLSGPKRRSRISPAQAAETQSP
ncbi:unnamed protein product [Pleuronectes platessa]|uniref:Cilium assembly protein DZIP1 domain-containing protein n=1 Tax=Pleuronectes platessa TaxID=8262 RepID=A0A9N7V369_PLEPL|nr:unnamed protein product [Pleuronectes platessa]